MFNEDQDGKGDGTDGRTPTPNWWEGPPPPGYTGTWPPPLQPGQSYGPNFGQILGGGGTFDPSKPGGGTGAYDPSNWGNITPTPDIPVGNRPTTAAAASVTAPTPTPTPSPQPPGGAPTFEPPGYSKPPAFSYGDFVAPDPSKLDQDPAFQYALKTEQDAIQRSAAARGVLNTGGTIYDLLGNAKDLTASGYANLFNRDLATYQTNRTNALDEYNTNYGTQYTDPYKYSYMGTQDAYNSRQHNYDLTTQYNWYRNLFDFNKDQDLFDRKFRLLSAA